MEQFVEVGDQGIATTPLRLSGKARFKNQIIDVISQVDYLEKGQVLEVIDVRGSRIVVTAVETKEAP